MGGLSRSDRSRKRAANIPQNKLLCSARRSLFTRRNASRGEKKKYKLGPKTGAEDLNAGPRTGWRGAGGHGRDGGRARAAVFTDVIKLIPAPTHPHPSLPTASQPRNHPVPTGEAGKCQQAGADYAVIAQAVQRETKHSLAQITDCKSASILRPTAPAHLILLRKINSPTN